MTAMAMAVGLIAAQGILAVALLVTWSRVRRLRYQLHDREARHGATLRALPDLLFVLSRTGIYLDYYAQKADRLFRPPESFLGRHVREVLPPDLAARFEDAFARTLASRDVVVLEYALELPGGVAEFEARTVPCGDDNVLSIVRDVTVRKASERALIASAEALRASHLQNQTLAGRLLVAQEEERQRIARDLHDDLGQRLALLNINVNRLADGRVDDPADLRRRVMALSEYVGELAVRVHDLSHELHPSTAATLGLVPALRGVCEDMSGRHGLDVDFRHDGVPLVLDRALSLSLYRIAQGALHNVVTHSGAGRAVVELRGLDGALELEVSDEGCGFDAGAASNTGLGLVSMRERARLLNGECHITTADGRGTRVAVRVPLCNSA
jgi:signal transduction histidine kinase